VSVAYLFVNRKTQNLWLNFHDIWEIGRLCTSDESIKFLKVRVRIVVRVSVIFRIMDRPVVDCVKSESGHLRTGNDRQIRSSGHGQWTLRDGH